MNLDEYREMKAAEQSTETEGAVDVQAVEATTTSTEQTVQTETQTTGVSAEQGSQETAQIESSTAPSSVYDLGGKQYTTEELEALVTNQSKLLEEKREIERLREQNKIQSEYYNKIQENPEFAKQFASTFNLPYLTPEQQKLKEMNDNYNLLLVKTEMNDLKHKYGDIDEKSVIELAIERNLNSLEDAYLVLEARKAQSNPRGKDVDLEALQEQIRQQVLAELQSKVDTSSIIDTRISGKEVVDNTPKLTPAELRVASAMKMKPEEYAKWKNVK